MQRIIRHALCQQKKDVTENIFETMPKLLFIQYRPFGTVLNGGDQGTKKNLDMLRGVLGEKNVEVYYLGLTPAKVKELVHKAQNYDYIFIDRSIFGVLAKALKAAGYEGKIITSFQNIEALYMDAKMPKHLPFRQVLIRCADKNDRWSCTYSDSVIVLNERDKTELQKRYNRTADILIPVSLADRCAQMRFDKTIPTQQRPLCLFLGAYFLANNEGIL